MTEAANKGSGAENDDERETISEAVRQDPETTKGEPTQLDDQPRPLGQEAPEIIHDAAIIGGRRLHRPLFESVITGLIGGMSVSFGAIALAWAAASAGGNDDGVAHIAGALAFPVGFVILLVGKSELFTEDFFLPVTAVLEREGRLVELARLWGVTLAFNLVGVLIFALLISRPGVLSSGPTDVLIGIAERKVDYSLSTAFIKALFAGWLMTLLTWLIVAAEGFGAKLVIVWIVGSLIVLAEFNHVVISASEMWIAMLSGGSMSTSEWFTANFLPSLAGNIVGGVIFVTLLHYVQALAHIRSGDDNA